MKRMLRMIRFIFFLLFLCMTVGVKADDLSVIKKKYTLIPQHYYKYNFLST